VELMKLQCETGLQVARQERIEGMFPSATRPWTWLRVGGVGPQVIEQVGNEKL